MSQDSGKKQKPRLVIVSSNSSPIPNSPIPAKIPAAQPFPYSPIIKADQLKQPSPEVRVNSFQPSEVQGKRAYTLSSGLTVKNRSQTTLEGLKQNLKTLNELQGRLHFMLTELEELVQK